MVRGKRVLEEFRMLLGAMEAERTYYISQGKNVQGPFERSRILGWIESGRVRPEMLFSLDGNAWVRGHDCPDLFGLTLDPTPAVTPAVPSVAVPPAVLAAPPAPAVPEARAPGSRTSGRRTAREERPRRGGRRRIPGSVGTVSIIDFILAGLRLLLALLLNGVATRLHEATELERAFGLSRSADQVIGLLQTMAVVYVMVAILGFVMGAWIRSGSRTAWGVHLVFAALASAAELWSVLDGNVRLGAILALALDVLVLVLLLGRDARAFFAPREVSRR
jgi:hypothetical protein